MRRPGWEVVYIDETSTHLWDLRGKVWQHIDDPLTIIRNSNRGKGITVYGAMSSTRRDLDWAFGESTNTQEFLRFL